MAPADNTVLVVAWQPRDATLPWRSRSRRPFPASPRCPAGHGRWDVSRSDDDYDYGTSEDGHNDDESRCTIALARRMDQADLQLLAADDAGHDVSSVLTNALLLISYDGSRFTGWSAANDYKRKQQQANPADPSNDQDSDKGSKDLAPDPLPPLTGKKQRRRLQRRGGGRRRNRGIESTPYSMATGRDVGDEDEDHGDGTSSRVGFVRSVQGVLQHHLAKLYGNVALERIVVEGCSRTDKGVHARGMVAQVYCYKENVIDDQDHDEHATQAVPDDISEETQSTTHASSSWFEANVIPGRRLPHPTNATDISYFVPLPKTLDQFMYTLNRMLPWDVRVMRIATTPTADYSCGKPSFHPTLSALTKTYQYRFSVGPQHDPTQWRTTWQITELPQLRGMEASADAVLTRLREAARVLTGRHDFAAFQGAPRSATDKLKRFNQSTFCSLESVTVELVDYGDSVLPWRQAQFYRVTICGDRFLYKMVRFLVGAMVCVGMTQQLDVADLQHALDTGSRQHLDNKMACAPAHGLVLAKVNYEGSDCGVQINWQP